MRRAWDISLAALALVAASPLMALLALAIAARDGRPILFRQTRAGRGGRPFTLIKFRTMRPALAGERTAAITAAGDARITALGRRLRARKWDELPQLWNILRGDMSWIGPRPELPRFVAARTEAFRPLLAVRPGLLDEVALEFGDEEARLAAAGGANETEAVYASQFLPVKLEKSLAALRRRQALGWRVWRDDAALLLRAARRAFLPGAPGSPTQ